MLANDYKKRVMIVDTSSEIGGDGDIPHAGIGCARRMQVPDSDMQHKVQAGLSSHFFFGYLQKNICVDVMVCAKIKLSWLKKFKGIN